MSWPACLEVTDDPYALTASAVVGGVTFQRKLVAATGDPYGPGCLFASRVRRPSVNPVEMSVGDTQLVRSISLTFSILSVACSLQAPAPIVSYYRVSVFLP